jgi:hypothetical protein
MERTLNKAPNLYSSRNDFSAAVDSGRKSQSNGAISRMTLCKGCTLSEAPTPFYHLCLTSQATTQMPASKEFGATFPTS